MKDQKLRVWWIPRIPMKAFYVNVKSIEEAFLITETLAAYDKFQFDNNVKGDYCNVGGLQYWDDDENKWLDWHDEEEGLEYDEYCNVHFRTN